MIRWLKYRSLLLARKHSHKKGWLSALLRSDLILWNRGTVSRGAAVGMFWTFVPMPLQMMPATLFCFAVRGNLPLALLCVWLTNPITLPPVIYLEYRLGEYVFGLLAKVEPALPDGASFYTVFAGGLRYVLTGSLILSSCAMVFGFFAARAAFNFSERRHMRQIKETAAR